MSRRGVVDLLDRIPRRGVPGSPNVSLAGAGSVLVFRDDAARPAHDAPPPVSPGWRTFTLDTLTAAVDARAEALAEEGVRPGDLHPVVVEADASGVVTLLALWRLGAVPVPLNPRLTADERAQAVDALAGKDPGEAQVVLWTSGTSGRPRGVALSWEAMATHVAAASRRLELDPARDVWLASLSLAHIGGLMVVVRALLTGSGLMAPGPVASPALPGLLMGTSVPGGGAPVPSHVSLVPTQLLRVLDFAGDGPPPPSLRCVLLGGAHTPRDLLFRALDAGWPVALTYGMTEMASQVATALPEAVRRKPGSVGRPLDGVDVRVATDGEVLVRGPTQASGYLDGTPLADARGWYATGDLGEVDADGDLWITGRRSDRIVTGGVNVDATEVEEAIRRHPAVADVCVAGVPDAAWGEAVAACVVPVEGEFDLDAVEAWLRDRLSGPKRPKRWKVVQALPLNANGKVERARVRGLLAGADS